MGKSDIYSKNKNPTQGKISKSARFVSDADDNPGPGKCNITVMQMVGKGYTKLEDYRHSQQRNFKLMENTPSGELKNTLKHKNSACRSTNLDLELSNF